MSLIFSRNSVFFFTRLLLQCNFNQELSVRQKKKCRFLDLLTSYNSKNSSSEMSPSSKLVCNNSRTFLKVTIALVFISKLQQEKALQQPAVARAFLMLFFAPLRRQPHPKHPRPSLPSSDLKLISCMAMARHF